MLDKERIKESLDGDDIDLILRELGSEEPTLDRYGNRIYKTVCHNGNSHKLYYYQENRMFKCYTDCGDTFDIYELVRRSKLHKNIELRFDECIKYVASLTNKHIHVSSILSTVKDYMIDDWDWIRKYKRVVKPQLMQLPIVDSKVMNVFHKIYHQSWIEEHITVETMKKYRIMYYIKEDKIVIPHYDMNGNLIGIRGRALREEDVLAGKKYMPLIVEKQMYNHPLAMNLYGLNHNKEAIKRIKKVIIFEAEKSILQCNSYFGEDCFAVACCGSQLSPFQRNIILSLEPKEVFFAFDKSYTDPNSPEAYKFAEKILKQAYPFTPYCQTYVLWDNTDLLPYKASPSDMGKDVLLALMSSKYEITTKNGVELLPCDLNQ